ncbi:MAG: DUF1018 domain-containing protein [Rhodocyclaceae bacterium]|nr:DUF1018 domain-containing protein [Rhodocyclaceae bacterium]
MPYDLAAARRAIFAECRQQGIDEDTRRVLLRLVGHVASGSTRDLGADAARRVLDHLRAKSAPAGRRDSEWAFIDAAAEDRRPLLRKICAVCRSMKVGRAYAEGVARRALALSGGGGAVVVRLEMLSAGQLWVVAAALSRTQRWGGPKAEATEMAARARPA